MAKVQRDIEVRQLVGVNERGVEVGQAVDEIILNGLRIGFVGHQPTDPINFIRPGVLGDKETLAAIRVAVKERIGGPDDRRINGVPEMNDEEQLDREEGRMPAGDEE